jgi:ABC-type multidrug transport system ATPase subunit
MTIQLIDIGKRFNSEWIFRHVNHVFQPASVTAILGPNGSGKSTLLQCAAGYIVPSEGKLEYHHQNTAIEVESIFRHLAIASPYLQLNESLTLKEVIELQSKFKAFSNNLSVSEIIELSGLQNAANKPLKNFSSGMKQRTRLTLAILSRSEILLLDEPLSNLDKAGENWYLNLMEKYATGKTTIICSNHHPAEIAPATLSLEINQFKVN